MKMAREALAWKVSHYAHLFSYSDGLRLAYNTLTGALLVLEDDDGERIAAILRGDVVPLSDHTHNMLVRAGFLVDSDIDEFDVVRELWNLGRRRKGGASLTILPTLSCNFRCPYCFETHTKGIMAQDVQDALVEFVETRVLPHTHGLSIEWFGGEPLTAFSVIQSLSQKFRKLCEHAKISPPEASITTNGYLLTPDRVRSLMALGVTSAQVSLDGPPEIHNRRRPLLGGRESFSRILENLKGLPEGFDLSIRINVDHGNKDSVFDLLLILRDEEIVPKATAYVARVEPLSDICEASDGMFLSSEEFAQFKRELGRKCQAVGISWQSNDPPRIVAVGYCMVDQRKGFVVQPDGKLLKCWAQAGNSNAAPVADLRRRETWARLSRSTLQTRDPFDDEECCECRILPACMGGCPAMRQNLRQQGKKKQCPPLRYSLAEEVRNLLERQTSGVKTKQLLF